MTGLLKAVHTDRLKNSFVKLLINSVGHTHYTPSFQPTQIRTHRNLFCQFCLRVQNIGNECVKSKNRLRYISAVLLNTVKPFNTLLRLLLIMIYKYIDLCWPVLITLGVFGQFLSVFTTGMSAKSVPITIIVFMQSFKHNYVQHLIL